MNAMMPAPKKKRKPLRVGQTGVTFPKWGGRYTVRERLQRVREGAPVDLFVCECDCPTANDLLYASDEEEAYVIIRTKTPAQLAGELGYHGGDGK